MKSAVEALRHLFHRCPWWRWKAGPDESVPVVAVDQFAGAAAATRHLLDLGHRNVWHVAGPADFLEAEQRISGWKATLKAAGIQPPPYIRGDWSARSGYEIGPAAGQEPRHHRGLRGQRPDGPRPAASLHEAGREIPRDISMVGLRRHPRGRLLHPSLDHHPPGLHRSRAPLPASAGRHDRDGGTLPERDGRDGTPGEKQHHGLPEVGILKRLPAKAACGRSGPGLRIH